MVAAREWFQHDGAGAVTLGSGYGNISFMNTGSISVGTNFFGAVNSISVGGNTAGATSAGTGSLVLAGGANVTLSGATAAGGMTLSVVAGAGGAGAGISAGTQSVSTGTGIFSNSNGISFGMAGSATVTGSYSVPVVSNAIQAVGSASAAGTNTSRFAADDHVHPGLNTLRVAGNTAGATTSGAGSIHLVGHNNITLSCDTGAGGITVSVIGAAAGTGAGISALSAGTTLASTGTVSFADGNGVTFGMNGQTMTASVAGAGGVAVSAGTQSVSTGTVIFSNSNGVSFGMAGSKTVTASFSAAPAIQYVDVGAVGRYTTALPLTGVGSKRPMLQPFVYLGSGMSLNTIRMHIARMAGNSVMVGTLGVALYSLANNTSVNLVSSFTQNYSLSLSSQWSGTRGYEFYGLSNMTLSRGQWWFAFLALPGADNTASMNIRLMGYDDADVGGFVHSGTDSTGASTENSHQKPFFGYYSATSGGFPAGIGSSEVSGAPAASIPAFYAVMREI